MKKLYWALGGASLLIAALASYLASRAPDGLERASEDLGISSGAAPHAAPLPDYQIPGLEAHLGGALAGGLGVLAVLVLLLGLGWILQPKKTT